jgi:predicted phage terminase large subunit-like protein
MPDRVSFKDILETTVIHNPWIPHFPHPKQALFLSCMQLECFYGGAAGGGKSDALLMGALQWIEHPTYAAIIFRRTYADLALPGALMDRAHEWLANTAAKFDPATKTWRFPSGATLSFGYVDAEVDKYRYAGSEYHFIAFDELTHFTETQYTFLFSRLRRRGVEQIPLRMRAASNPGGIGHDWVRKRFVLPGAGRIFIPASLADNPSLAYDDYVKSLEQLDPITREQLLRGDWDAWEGGRFKRAWFRRFRTGPHYTGGQAYFPVPGEPKGWKVEHCWKFIICDPACTEKDTTKGLPLGTGDPDYTVIGTFAVTPARELFVLDIVRERIAIDQIVPRICDVQRCWQAEWIGIEAVSAFIYLVKEAQKTPGLPPVNTLESRVAKGPNQTAKLARATPAIILASQGRIFLPDEPTLWLDDFLAELIQFTGDPKLDAHDDCVDVISYACAQFSGMEASVGIAGKDLDEMDDREPVYDREPHARERGLFGARG